MNQENLLIEKIEKIKNTGVSNKIRQSIYNCIYDEQYNEIEIRVKSNESALKKLKIRDYEKAEDIRDIVGVMITTDTKEEAYNIAKKIILKNPICKVEDYIQNPKNGYKSIHINYAIKTKEIEDIPVEIQIKTENMKKAQNLVHDLIYKNEHIPTKMRNTLSKIAFKYIEYKQELEKHSLSQNQYIYKFNEIK